MITCKVEALEAHIEYGIRRMHLELKSSKCGFFPFNYYNLVESVNQTKRYIKKIFFWPLYKFQGETFSLLFVLVPAGLSIV